MHSFEWMIKKRVILYLWIHWINWDIWEHFNRGFAWNMFFSLPWWMRCPGNEINEVWAQGLLFPSSHRMGFNILNNSIFLENGRSWRHCLSVFGTFLLSCLPGCFGREVLMYHCLTFWSLICGSPQCCLASTRNCWGSWLNGLESNAPYYPASRKQSILQCWKQTGWKTS